MEEEKKPQNNKPIAIFVIIAAVAIALGIAVFWSKPEVPDTPSLPAQSLPAISESVNQEDETSIDPGPAEDRETTRLAIEDTVNLWLCGQLSYDDAILKLQDLQNSSYPDLVAFAGEKLAFVELEESCNILRTKAKNHITAEEYPAAFETLNSIDLEYSQYALVEELYLSCQDQVMAAVEAPTSIEEFESFIRLLGDCLAVYESQDLFTRQQELSDELVIFIEVSEIIQTATDLYDSEQYEESFVTLALGLEEYPDEDRLATTLVDYHDHYIISVTKEAVVLCEKEEYKDALAVVGQAIEEYDCEEFRLLQESIKEQKSFLYRFKNDMVEKFTVMAQGWESEEFDVKQAAASTGAYIVKSGEKIFLGDYSEEDVTILTFGGNIIASLANVDFLFDLRDLTYDVIHWGEGECFAVYLATDVIALLPVIGVVKYFDHFKTVADGVKSADLVDSVADIGKGSANAAEVADAVKDAAKTGESIIETIDSAKDAARIGEAAKDVATDISKTYRLIPTQNSKLLGSKHPETGIEFVLKKLKYSDGQMIQGVFPVFSSFADIDLPRDLYKAKFPDQQKYCLEQLQKKTRPIFGKYRKSFTEEQLDDIANGILPEGFTWHHNEKEGLMQLVDTATHDATGHTGGMSLWGIGY